MVAIYNYVNVYSDNYGWKYDDHCLVICLFSWLTLSIWSPHSLNCSLWCYVISLSFLADLLFVSHNYAVCCTWTMNLIAWRVTVVSNMYGLVRDLVIVGCCTTIPVILYNWQVCYDDDDRCCIWWHWGDSSCRNAVLVQKEICPFPRNKKLCHSIAIY